MLPDQAITPRRVARLAAPALLLACAVLLPWLGKAFTVDDTLFLRQAQHAMSEPLHPAAFDIVWFDRLERLSKNMPSGPTMAWLLIPTVALGGSELFGHLTSLLLLLVAIAATVSLALRLGRSDLEARLAGLFLLSMPALVAMAATVMPDVAAMSLGVLGLERLVAWSASRRWTQGLAAAVGLAAAALARAHLIWLVGVGALLLLDGAPLDWRAWLRGWRLRWLPLLVAPALALLVIELGRDTQGHDVTGAAESLASLGNIGRNALALFSHWSWSMSLPLGWALLRWRRLLRGRALWAAIPGALWLLASEGRHGQPGLLLAVMLGLAVLGELLLEALESRDGAQLGLALWLLAALPLLIYVHLPPKYLVASAPAAALLLAQAASHARRWWAWSVGALVGAAGLGLGLLITQADAKLAGLEREAVRREIAPRIAAGAHVWFSGHWGFQWYAEQAGARPLTSNGPRASRGDIVVVDSEAFPQGLINLYPKRRLLDVLDDTEPGGRIMCRAANAGFYSNSWGDLPWAWSERGVDQLSTWELGSP